MPQKNYESIEIHNDQPIDDAHHFNFDIYSEKLAKIILSTKNKPPFTIAINGGWGTGKTSLMKAIKENLEKSNDNNQENQRKIIPVWFDAWKYCQTDSLLSALSLEIHDSVKENHSSLTKGRFNRYKQKCYYFFHRHEINKGLIIDDTLKFALSTVSLINGIPPLNSSELSVSNWINKPVYKDKLSYYNRFNQFLDAIIQTHFPDSKNPNNSKTRDSSDNAALVIFIDDLDRCPPHSVTNILESINLFFDKSQCIFVIGVDLPKIACLIEKHYNKYSDQKEGNTKSPGNKASFKGLEYLQKMIQIQFTIPAIHEKELKLFIEELVGDNECLKDNSSLIVEALQRPNIREIKRFFNSFVLLSNLIHSIDNKGVNDNILLRWQLIDYNFPELVKSISFDPYLLIAIYDFNINMLPFIQDHDRLEYEYGFTIEQISLFDQYCDNSLLEKILKNGEPFTKETIEDCLHLYRFTKLMVNDEGNITVAAGGYGIYTIGKNIKFSGTNTRTNTTYLFIVGPKLAPKGSNLKDHMLEVENNKPDSFSFVDVESDSTWSFHWNTLYKNLVPGNYQMFAVSKPNNLGNLENLDYATVSITLREPFITATTSTPTITQNEQLIITGNAEGIVNKAYIWIIGKEELFHYQIQIDQNGAFDFPLPSNDLQSMQNGQYFVLVTYPFYKEKSSLEYKDGKILHFDHNTNVNEINIKDMNGAEIAQLLIELLNSTGDEAYYKLTFIKDL
ncbi:hypothetical protein MKMG_01799 [Methanogenium sp. MK-MG]|nr:hypothetical protein MKMG_01799 [Methanogenium sp. MK-MG]